MMTGNTGVASVMAGDSDVAALTAVMVVRLTEDSGVVAMLAEDSGMAAML